MKVLSGVARRGHGSLHHQMVAAWDAAVDAAAMQMVAADHDGDEAAFSVAFDRMSRLLQVAEMSAAGEVLQ